MEIKHSKRKKTKKRKRSFKMSWCFSWHSIFFFSVLFLLFKLTAFRKLSFFPLCFFRCNIFQVISAYLFMYGYQGFFGFMLKTSSSSWFGNYGSSSTPIERVKNNTSFFLFISLFSFELNSMYLWLLDTFDFVKIC